MKRVFAILLALAMVFALSACGGKDAPAPSGGQGSTAANQGGAGPESGAPTPDTQPPDDGDIVPEVDMSAILGGATDTVWGKQDEATKQAIIADAKNDGVDVSFGADGSMTVVDTDGSVMVQNPDGTWTYQDEDGGEAQIGGDWPDNEFTKLVPKPDFALTAASADDGGFTVAFTDATIEQMRDYAEKVKAAGFTADAQTEDQEVMGMVIYTYSASNADGYTVEIFSASGTSGMSISKP